MKDSDPSDPRCKCITVVHIMHVVLKHAGLEP